MRVKLAWKKRNSDNAVYLVDNPVGISNISVGPFSYGPIRVVTSAANPRIQIGTFCSIASNVTLVTDNEHPLDRVSTFPFKVFVLGLPVREATGKGGIVIDDDVWIGYGATILDGVHIGRGGGHRSWGGRYQGCGTLHDRRRRSRQTHQEALQQRGRRSLAQARLLKSGQELRGDPSQSALPTTGRERPCGAAR